MKCIKNRVGDNAPMAWIEYIDRCAPLLSPTLIPARAASSFVSPGPNAAFLLPLRVSTLRRPLERCSGQAIRI